MLFELDQISKFYGIHPVFRNVNFSIERETFTILTGPSGSGKTTLFKMVCGVEKPSTGKVLFLGKLLMEHSPFNLKQIGFIFHIPRGLPSLTVFENVALPLVMDGVPAVLRQKKVLEMLDMLGLRHRAQTEYRFLSGGEAQKAEFARALIRKPRLILADEPTAHLDAVQAELLFEILWDQHREGATVFVATHHPPVFHHPLILRYQIENFMIKEIPSKDVLLKTKMFQEIQPETRIQKE